MKKIVIAGAARTAIGKFGGSLQAISACELGSAAISAACARAGVKPEQADAVYMGNVLQAGLGQNPARQAALKAGFPVTVSCMTVNKVCGSGLAAVALGAQAIQTGDAETVVAGGMENMSRAPFLLDRARFGYRLGSGELTDEILRDGLLDAYTGVHMALTAEALAEKFHISRAEQDEFAFRSQEKCARAVQEGKFKEEILSLVVPAGKGGSSLAADEYPRPDTSVEKLAALKPVFKKDGTVTAGNASGINDGAAAVVLMAEETASRSGIKPLAEIVAFASAGVEPSLMGIGPVPAVRKALERAGLSLADVDLVELNEAFAAQSIAVMQDLGLDEARVNVNGGAIALGHPIGASGARILVTLLHEMRRRKARYGLATLCIGGGEGFAMIVKGR